MPRLGTAHAPDRRAGGRRSRSRRSAGRRDLRRLEGVPHDLEDRRSGARKEIRTKDLRAGSHSSARRSLTIPPVALAAFDPVSGRYTTVETSPLTIAVEGALEPAASSEPATPVPPVPGVASPSPPVHERACGSVAGARSSKARGHSACVSPPSWSPWPRRWRDPALEAPRERGKVASSHAAPHSPKGDSGRRVLRRGPPAHRRALREALGGRGGGSDRRRRSVEHLGPTAEPSRRRRSPRPKPCASGDAICSPPTCATVCSSIEDSLRDAR